MDTITIPADTFVEGNLNRDTHSFGKGMVIDGGLSCSSACYIFDLAQEGEYELWVQYASGLPRPVRISIDRMWMRTNVLGAVTGGYTAMHLKWGYVGTVLLSKGSHQLIIQCTQLIPHVAQFFLKKLNTGCSQRIKRQREKQYQISLFHRPSFFYEIVKKKSPLIHYLRTLGMYEGNMAFCGPTMVQIDLTNNCNNNCIGCWCNSPLLEEKTMPREEKEKYLPREMVRELLDQLSVLGVKEIYYAGGGEPCMYPYIREVLRYTKEKGFICYVNTNFTLIDEEFAQDIIAIGVDSLTISVWAGTAHTYHITHPNKKEEDFVRLENVLKWLNTHKQLVPFTKVYHVISRLNYGELHEMVDFALRTSSDAVEFTMMDTIPEKTDRLLLSSLEQKSLRQLCAQIQDRSQKGEYPSDFIFLNFDQFVSRVDHATEGKGEYDKQSIGKSPCYIGWDFARIIADGKVNGCLKAHRIPTGDLFEDSFLTVWNSTAQQFFRKKTKAFDLQDPFFSMIGNDPDARVGCYKSCDDLGRVRNLQKMVEGYGGCTRVLLQWASTVARYLRGCYLLFQKAMVYVSVRSRKENALFISLAQGRYALNPPQWVMVEVKDVQGDGQQETAQLHYPALKRLIGELARMNTRHIHFGGRAEPLLYPYLHEAIEYAKQLGLRCSLSTRLSGCDIVHIEQVLKTRIDEIWVNAEVSERESGYFMQRVVPRGTMQKKDALGPCYIGWLFSWIRANGDVCPCLAARSLKVGNIYEESFQNIWNSRAQRNFRGHAKFLEKTHPYFAKMGCLDTCPHYAHNQYVEQCREGFPLHVRHMLHRYAGYLSSSQKGSDGYAHCSKTGPAKTRKE